MCIKEKSMSKGEIIGLIVLTALLIVIRIEFLGLYIKQMMIDYDKRRYRTRNK